jgi:hypothetical protein
MVTEVMYGVSATQACHPDGAASCCLLLLFPPVQELVDTFDPAAVTVLQHPGVRASLTVRLFSSSQCC